MDTIPTLTPTTGHIDNIFAWHETQGNDESGNTPVIIVKETKKATTSLD